MALVNCPDCGREVSSTAPSCLSCGFIMENHPQNIAKKKKRDTQRNENLSNAWDNRFFGKVLIVAAFVLAIFTYDTEGIVAVISGIVFLSLSIFGAVLYFKGVNQEHDALNDHASQLHEDSRR